MTSPIAVISTASPSPIDVHVGGLLRRVRLFRKMTLEELGKELGVSQQQIAKYETGENRLAVATLHRASKVLGCNIAWFFEGLDEAAGEPPPVLGAEQIALLDQFDRIADNKLRRVFIHFARDLADRLMAMSAHERDSGAAGDAAPHIADKTGSDA